MGAWEGVSILGIVSGGLLHLNLEVYEELTRDW